MCFEMNGFFPHFSLKFLPRKTDFKGVFTFRALSLCVIHLLSRENS